MRRLACAAPPRAGATRVVLVDGRSGAGKTRLAAELAAGLEAPVVELEFLYPGWDGLEAGVALLVDEVLAPLAAGERVLVPRWNWRRRRLRMGLHGRRQRIPAHRPISADQRLVWYSAGSRDHWPNTGNAVNRPIEGDSHGTGNR